MTTHTVPVTQADEPKLLPCPFCGGKAALEDKQPFDNITMWFAICSRCYILSRSYPSKQDAIAAWNTRLASTQEHATGEVERLVAIVQHEAQNGASTPVDYGDAEQIVRAILAALQTPASPFPREEVAALVEEMRAAVTYQYMPMSVRTLLSKAATLLQGKRP